MNFKSFKLLIGFGLCAVAASSMPACGGDDDDGGGSGGSTGGKDAGNDSATGGGGTGGTSGSGGSGGTGGSGGSGGSDGGQTIPCKSATCKSYSIAGQVTLGPCCAGAGKDICGVDVDSTVGGLIGIKPGCYELDQKGSVDSTCPALSLLGQSFPGCCNATAKQCSYLLDASGLGGPNMGCVDPAQIPTDGSTTPKACGGSDGGSDAATDATGDAPADTGAG